MGPDSTAAFDESVFLSPIPDDHLCPVCHNVMRNVAQTSCGHRFCMDCIKRALAMNSICPLCRARPCRLDHSGSPFFRDRAHERIILDKAVGCPLCHQTITFKELVTDHADSCPDSLVACRFREFGCSSVSKRKETESHEAKCEHRVQDCPKCGTSVNHRQMVAHLLFKCAANKVRCLACSKPVCMFRMGTHRYRCSWQKTKPATGCGRHL